MAETPGESFIFIVLAVIFIIAIVIAELSAQYDQPVINNPSICSTYSNETVNQSRETVSSLSNGNPSLSITNESSGCNYYIPLCGKLSNYMVYSQSRVFVCIPQK